MDTVEVDFGVDVEVVLAAVDVRNVVVVVLEVVVVPFVEVEVIMGAGGDDL